MVISRYGLRTTSDAFSNHIQCRESPGACMTPVDVRLKPDEYQAAAALRAGLRQFTQASEHALQLHGLTTERYELLLAIKAIEDEAQRATVSELTSVLGVAQSSTTQLVRRAEDAGLLRREVSTADARVRYLRLTPRGERQLARAVADLRQERQLLATLVRQL
jgi:DNA-binding MarR family transcriptional regulator